MRWLLLACVVATPGTASAQRLVDPPDGLREISRAIEVTLHDGMALVTTRVELAAEGARPLEARVRVPVPTGAGLAALEVCSGDRCRAGVPAPVSDVYEVARSGRRASLEPIAIASVRDMGWRRSALVEAAPIVAGRPFVVTVRYVAPAPVVRGIATFDLPAQGHDPIAGPVAVTVRAPGLEPPTIDGALGPRAASDEAPSAIRARLPEGTARASAWSVRCGRDRCSRLRVVAGPVRPSPRDVFLLLDASPSARAADPVMRARVIATLMEALAPDARVQRVAFARRAEVLDAEPRAPRDVPVAEPLPVLGNQTSLAAAWSAVRHRVRAAHDPLVLLVGDGAVPSDLATRTALAELVDVRAELSLVTVVDDRHVTAELEDAVARSLGLSAIALDDAQLPSLARVAAPIVAARVHLDRGAHGPLRAGEELVFETRHERGGAVPILAAFGRRVVPSAPRQLWADGLATRMGDDPREVLVAASPDQIEAAAKGETPIWGAGFSPRIRTRTPRIIRCFGGCGCSVVGSISREALGRMRRRLAPAVRACFAQVRAGREAWSARATLSLSVRYGELVSASVPSTTDPALTSCLAHVADEDMDIPVASHVVNVNFYFYSEALAAPPTELPLSPRVARALDELDGLPADLDVLGGAANPIDRERGAVVEDDGAAEDAVPLL